MKVSSLQTLIHSGSFKKYTGYFWNGYYISEERNHSGDQDISRRIILWCILGKQILKQFSTYWLWGISCLFSITNVDIWLSFISSTEGNNIKSTYKKDDVMNFCLTSFNINLLENKLIVLFVKSGWKAKLQLLYCPMLLPLLHQGVHCWWKHMKVHNSQEGSTLSFLPVELISVNNRTKTNLLGKKEKKMKCRFSICT